MEEYLHGMIELQEENIAVDVVTIENIEDGTCDCDPEDIEDDNIHETYCSKGVIEEALKEDVGDGDHSTLSCIPQDKRGRAVLKIKQEGVLAGVAVAQKIFNYAEPSTSFDVFKQDGETMQPGEKAFEVEASIQTILTCERLVLNCMQRMSGIATLTRQYVDKLKGYHTKVLDTRKTTPNFFITFFKLLLITKKVNYYCYIDIQVITKRIN